MHRGLFLLLLNFFQRSGWTFLFYHSRISPCSRAECKCLASTLYIMSLSSPLILKCFNLFILLITTCILATALFSTFSYSTSSCPTHGKLYNVYSLYEYTLVLYKGRITLSNLFPKYFLQAFIIFLGLLPEMVH